MEKKLFNFLKNKLNGKQYTLRIVGIFIVSFLVSKPLTIGLEAQTQSFLYSENAVMGSFLNYAYFVGIVIGAVTLVSLVLSAIFSVQRVRDIVPDAPIWPYAVAVLLIGLIPIIGFLMYILLMFLPSGYLTQEKRVEIIGKFA